MATIKELSVFFPTYNEEGNIKRVVEAAKKVLNKVASEWEIIIVDDGSRDSTGKVADELSSKDNKLTVVHHKSNRGYGGALKTGFEKAKYEWIAFTDSDGQFDFAEIDKFIAKKDEADLVLGYRKNRADSFLRKIFTFGWSTLARLVLGLKAKDYSCGFKMIKKKVYEEIQPLVGEEKVTQIEMLVKARRKGFKFIEIGVNHYPRLMGKPTGSNIMVVAKSILDMFRLWARMHGIGKREALIVSGILVVGAILRLYRISEYMIFLGDEGRDMIIVRRLLAEGHPPLIGPGTSIGNMYLGPLYYYMMALPTLIANFSPVGPAVMVALIGVATVGLVWFVGREWFNKVAGLSAAFLYAISPTIIAYSNFSWNPNIMPFFALLTMYAIWKVLKVKELRWLIVGMISFAFVLQSHYFGLLLLPVIIYFWAKSGSSLKHSAYAVLIFFILMSPIAIFDFRHDFLNFKAFKSFSLEGGSSFTSPVSGVLNIPLTFSNIVIRSIGGRNEIIGTLFAIVLFIGAIWAIKNKKLNPVLIGWIGVGVIGLSMYKSEIYDHYMGFLFPAIFILFGAIFSRFPRYFLISSLVVLLVVSTINSNLRTPPNRQLQRSVEISSFIHDKSEGEEFNLATLSELNRRDVYLYFLLLSEAKVVDIDPYPDVYTVTDQLFVVCERPKEKCDPTHDPSAWITSFGWSKISESWEIAGVNIYKLSHAK